MATARKDFPGAGRADGEDHVVATDGVDVALLAARLGRDPLLARGDRDGVAEHRLEVDLRVVGDHPDRRPHLARAQRSPRADQIGQLGQRALGSQHLALVAPERDVVTAGHDADVELGFERTEVTVVAAEEVAQVDVGGQRQPARDGGRFAQRLSFLGPVYHVGPHALGPPAGRRSVLALRGGLGQGQADVQLAQALGRHFRWEPASRDLARPDSSETQ